MKLAAAVLAILAAGMCLSAAERPPAFPPRAENAAVDYWAAVAELRGQRLDADPDLVAVADELRGLPAGAFSVDPRLVRLVEGDADAMEFLHMGAAKGFCRFDVKWEDGFDAKLLHLGAMRELARRAVVYAKLLDSQGRHGEAAEVYADLIQLSSHVAEEPTIISMLVGAAILDVTSKAVEEWLAGESPRGAVAALARRLEAGRRVHAFRTLAPKYYLDAERRIMTDYVRRAADALPDDLGRFARGGNDPAGIRGHLSRLKPEEKETFMERAIAGYDEAMKAYADAFDGPYFMRKEAIEKANRSVAEATKPGADPRPEDVLLPVLMPALTRAVDRFYLAEARLGALELLVAAAAARGRDGKYPAVVEDLAPAFPDGLPKDPFTGKGFVYELVEGRPRVAIAPHADLAAERPARAFALDLTRRLEEDRAALAEFTKVRAGAERD
jgi:hypothetical protein